MKNMFPIVLALSIFIFSCGSIPKVYTLKSSYNATEMESYHSSGSAKITGSMFAKTMGGDVKHGAGNTIYLFPATTYIKEIVGKLKTIEHPEEILGGPAYGLLHDLCSGDSTKLYVSDVWIGRKYISFDSTYNSSICKLGKTATCDVNSNFEFENLPAGDYYLESGISWLVAVATSKYKSAEYSGATIRMFVSIKDGEVKKVTMTP